MKKLFGVLFFAAVAVVSAFAEITFGGWVRTLPTFVGSDGKDIKTCATAVSWGEHFWSRFDATWISEDGKAGLTMRLNADSNGVNLHDDVGIWLKPIDMIKIQIGWHENFGELRGDLCYGSWDWLRPSTIVIEDEGITFSSAPNKQGLGLEITPTDTLKIVILTPLEAVLQRGDYGFGETCVETAFTFGEIGTVKAGFFGEYTKDTVEGDSKKYGRIEAAFDLIGIEKLFVTVGAAFRLASSDYWKGNALTDASKINELYMLKTALGASYGITEALKLSATFATLLFNKDVANNPATVFGVGVNYALNDALGLVADVRMLMPNNDKDATLSFMMGLDAAINSNASLGVGFQGVVGLGDKATPSALQIVEAAGNNKFVWAVPIKAELTF
ncbi:MAG: hypothetical protein IK015_12245 [Treponema sp.]|nr:hypothetical protein [Treponema sp.]